MGIVVETVIAAELDIKLSPAGYPVRWYLPCSHNSMTSEHLLVAMIIT